MPERYSGPAATLYVQVTQPRYNTLMAHGLAEGRGVITEAFPQEYRTRDEAGGVVVKTPLGFTSGYLSWSVDRTIETERQLFDAHHRAGAVRYRPRGDGSGLPQLAFNAIFRVSRIIVASGSRYSITALKTGALTTTPQP